jgi:hypothetical protein
MCGQPGEKGIGVKTGTGAPKVRLGIDGTDVTELVPAQIVTPYRIEAQGLTAAEAAALAEARSGATLCRTGELGQSMAAESQYWSLQNPTTAGYQSAAKVVGGSIVVAGGLENTAEGGRATLSRRTAMHETWDCTT